MLRGRQLIRMALGGVFVMRPPATLVFEYRSRFAGDNPSFDEVEDAVLRPTGST